MGIFFFQLYILSFNSTNMWVLIFGGENAVQLKWWVLCSGKCALVKTTAVPLSTLIRPNSDVYLTHCLANSQRRKLQSKNHPNNIGIYKKFTTTLKLPTNTKIMIPVTCLRKLSLITQVKPVFFLLGKTMLAIYQNPVDKFWSNTVLKVELLCYMRCWETR